MKLLHLYLISSLLVVLTAGCGSDGDSKASRILSNVTGSSGELVVVTENTLWEGDLGKKLQGVFEVATPALPQYEPMFTLLHVSPAGFGKLYQNHRNILILTVDQQITEPKVTFQTDAYASSQILFKAVGPNSEAVVNEIVNRKQLIIDKLTEAERDRWMRYFRRTQSSHNLNRLRDQHSISMPIPAGFRVDETKPGFAWVALETPTTTQSVLIHYFKASGSSVFTRDSMIMIRNAMTKSEIEGPTPGTYMAIEERYPVEYRVFSHNGRNYAEIRGLWTLINGFMGGPFITIMTYDEKNRRAVMLDGFVYAPNDNKRELMRQVEALLYSADFHSSEEAVVVAKKPKEKK